MPLTLPMQHLFTPAGLEALQSLMRRRPLLAFDFDGTLAPIVERPADARVSPAVSASLAALAQRLPVAIVTGRGVDDVRGRLGFEPRFIVGNHGAEDDRDGSAVAAWVQALDPLRQRLAACARDLQAAGVTVEDKGLSIALHYRLALSPERAQKLIADLTTSHDAPLQIFGGKRVVNVTSAAAPDKSHAVHRLRVACGASCAFFAGDDVNDEPVFASAGAGWLTVRVGRADTFSHASYWLDDALEMATLLERMVVLSPALPGAQGAIK